MTDKELEQRMKDAVEHAAPNDLEGVLSRCREQKGNVIPMAKAVTGRRMMGGLLAACLALALVGGAGGVWYQRAYAVASVISLDVNPSIELRINREERVLSCTPLNEDAETVLAEMDGGEDLKGAKLDVAVNAVVGALVRHGYLDGLSSAILVSVEDKDQTRAAQLEAELKATIGGALETQAPNTTILSQNLPMGVVYEAYGEHHSEEDHHISNGKAALVHKVMEMNGTIALSSTTAYDKLCSLTVEELNDLLVLGETRIPIGCSEASMAVGIYSGTAILSSAFTEADPELDEGIYEVELHTAWGEFEYKVDAFTGEILSGPANVLELAERPADADDETKPAVISSTEAFNAAAADCFARWPELSGYNTYIIANHLDWEDGRQIYEVEFNLGGGYEFEYKVDAATGKVLEWESDYKRPATIPDPKPSTPSLIGEEAAWAAVYKHAGCTAGDTAFRDCELDGENGRYHCYELEFCVGDIQYEYEIDCYTGAVLKYEWETCDEEDHGHHAAQTSHNSHHGSDHH